MTAILIVIAVFLSMKLLVNLMHGFMERRFVDRFGFRPPQSRDKLAIRAYQPMVDRRLRELAENEIENQAKIKMIVSQMTGFPLYAFIPKLGRLTERGRELWKLNEKYLKIATFKSARGLADFFDFQTSLRIEDYL